NHLFVSTCTSFFLLVFLFLNLRGPGGRGHREHKCIYCPHSGTLPRRQPPPQFSYFLAKTSLIVCFYLILVWEVQSSLLFVFILPAFVTLTATVYPWDPVRLLP